MLRYFPCGFTRADFLNMLDDYGFKGSYDFVYLPVNFEKWVPFGYAFANFISHEEAVRVWEHFDGFTAWPITADASAGADSPRPCEVCWGAPLQGLSAHVERF